MCAQESQIVDNTRRNSPVDTLHGIQGIDRLVFLEVNPGQAENGLVAHRFLDIAIDHRLDGAPGALVHPVCQFEITHVKLRLVDVIMKGVPFGLIYAIVLHKLGVEPDDGIEPVPLKCVIKSFSEIEILQFFRSGRAGRRRRRGEYQYCQCYEKPVHGLPAIQTQPHPTPPLEGEGASIPLGFSSKGRKCQVLFPAFS